MKKLKLNKTTKNNLITYGIVILAYIIVEAMLAGRSDHQSDEGTFSSALCLCDSGCILES